jgi:hypothetical protein
MARRLNFPKAAQDRKMRVQGTERLDDPGTVTRTEFRNVMNELSRDPSLDPGGSAWQDRGAGTNGFRAPAGCALAHRPRITGPQKTLCQKGLATKAACIEEVKNLIF